MKAFLKHISPRSYFGQLIKKNPSFDPHSPKFVMNLLREFETGFLSDQKLKLTVFNNILSHIELASAGAFELKGLNLYDPDPTSKQIMADVYHASLSPYWLIPAQTYKAIISRDLAKRQSRISRGVSFRTLEDCLDKIMYNIGVLLVNEDMMEGDDSPDVCDFKLMFPRIRKALIDEASLNVGEAIAQDTRLAQDISFAFYWYYMVSCSFVGPDDPQFPVSNTDRDDTWDNIQRLVNQLPANPTEDQCIVFINKFIDMCHGRGSLAGAFVEGGAATCAAVSSMKPDELHEHSREEILEAITYWENVLKHMR